MFRGIFLIPSSGFIKSRMMPDYWVQTASKTCGALCGNKVHCCNAKDIYMCLQAPGRFLLNTLYAK